MDESINKDYNQIMETQTQWQQNGYDKLRFLQSLSDQLSKKRESSQSSSTFDYLSRTNSLSMNVENNISFTPKPKNKKNALQSQLQIQLRTMLETCKDQAIMIQNQKKIQKQLTADLQTTKQKLIQFRFKQLYACALLAHYRASNKNQQELIQHLTIDSNINEIDETKHNQEIEKLKQKNLTLNTQIEELQNKLNNIEIHQTSFEVIKELRDENQRSHLRQMDNLKEKIKELTTQNTKLLMEKEENMDKNERLLHDELKVIDNELEIKTLREKIASSKERNNRLEMQIMELKTEIKFLNEEKYQPNNIEEKAQNTMTQITQNESIQTESVLKYKGDDKNKKRYISRRTSKRISSLSDSDDEDGKVLYRVRRKYQERRKIPKNRRHSTGDLTVTCDLTELASKDTIPVQIKGGQYNNDKAQSCKFSIDIDNEKQIAHLKHDEPVMDQIMMDENRKWKNKNDKLVKKIDKLSGEQFCYKNEIKSLNYQITQLEKTMHHLENENRKLQIKKNPELSEIMDRLLSVTLMEGMFARKYNRRGRYKFKKIIIDFEKGFIDFESDKLELKYLQQIHKGINTQVMQKVYGKKKLVDNTDTVISLVFPSRTLDIQTSNKITATSLYQMLHEVVTRNEKKTMFSSTAPQLTYSPSNSTKYNR